MKGFLSKKIFACLAGAKPMRWGIFLISFVLFFAPLFVKANDCESNGGTCVEISECESGFVKTSYSYDCSEVCCDPSGITSSTNTTPATNTNDSREGSTGGFLFFDGPIVPCGKSSDVGTGNESCTLCHLFVMLKNVFDLMFSLVIIAAILFITIGGVIYIVSAGNQSMVSMAKEIIKKTLIGFALMIGGWLIVYTLLTFLSTGDMVGKGSGGWFEFECDTTSKF